MVRFRQTPLTVKGIATELIEEIKYKRQNARKQRIVEFVNAYKSERGCLYCPENDSCCLDFHHKTDNKEFAVGKAVSWKYGFDRIKNEIAKCDVVCSNCHRKLHKRNQTS